MMVTPHTYDTRTCTLYTHCTTYTLHHTHTHTTYTSHVHYTLHYTTHVHTTRTRYMSHADYTTHIQVGKTLHRCMFVNMTIFCMHRLMIRFGFGSVCRDQGVSTMHCKCRYPFDHCPHTHRLHLEIL